MRQLMAAPEDQRAPRTYVPCPSDDFLAETITAISDEWNDYKFEEKMKKYGLGKEVSATGSFALIAADYSCARRQ